MKIAKTTMILSVLIIILSATGTFTGIFFNNIYNDNEFVKAVWLGNDIVTLIIVIPVMILALIFARRPSIKAQLVLMGTLWYMLYNYLFYLYGAAFNIFFICYVSIFILSIAGLILMLTNLDLQKLRAQVQFKDPVKWISVFMFIFALTIGGLWMVGILNFIVSDELPVGITQTDHPTSVVYATDLSLLVPSLLIGATLLWRYNIWGYIISTIALVKAILYPLVLVVGAAIAKSKTGIWDSLVPLYLALWLASLVAFIYLLKGIHTQTIR